MRNRFAFIVGMFVLASPGCLYHGGYPNGYYNGYYGAGPSVLPPQSPPWTGYPNGPVNQQPIYTPGTGPTPLDGGGTYTPSNPGNAPNGSQPGNSPSNWTTPPTYKNPPGGGNAPTFDPNTPGGGGGTGVPDPLDDPNNNRSPGAQRPALSPTSTSRVSDDASSPFSQEDSSRLPRKFAEENVAEADESFQTPVRQASGTGDGEIRQANRTTLSSQSSSKIYGYDPQFQWVKGVVEFDEPSGTWVIMYDNNPQPSDQFGGELTLADHPALARLRTEDKVRIEGSLDQTATDAAGKPLFQISRLKKQ